jgi:hypothetical protein
MPWKIAAQLYLLSSFAFVAIPFLVADLARAVAAIRSEQRR